MLKKTLESPLECKEIKPINPKGNQFRIYSLEGLMLKLQDVGHLMCRNGSFGKYPDAGKGRRQEETGTTEDEMVG